ncbi:MAG TPA: hypothetical protein VEU08_19810 [Vicinamibacterales bacterium]|nr:hypothetical protein [Vicinamibacterales bacterium]
MGSSYGGGKPEERRPDKEEFRGVWYGRHLQRLMGGRFRTLVQRRRVGRQRVADRHDQRGNDRGEK